MLAHTIWKDDEVYVRLEPENWKEWIFFTVSDAFIWRKPFIKKYPRFYWKKIVLDNKWVNWFYRPVPMIHFYVTRSHYCILTPLVPFYMAYALVYRLWWKVANLLHKRGCLSTPQEGVERHWFWPRYLKKPW